MDTRLIKSLFLLLVAIALVSCTQPDKPDVSLALALKNRDINQIERHIYWDTDLNRPVLNDLTPLQIAAHNGHIILVNLLLDNDVELETKDPDGHTALFHAIMQGRTQVAEILLKAGAQLDADQFLLQAAEQNQKDRDIIGYLIKKGADPETTDSRGNTPLMIAVANGNHRLSRHLIDAGSNVNHLNKQQETALKIARKAGYPEIEQLLISNGAK